jgi:hypothetical protein
MDLSALNKLLPPPLTNPFFRTPGQALDAVIAPIQQQLGIPGSYQDIERGIGQLLNPRPRIGSIPPSANGESYRRAELRLADAARPGGGGGGGGNAGYSVAPFSSPAAERAYQSDKAAVAQQVAQDPALSQYERDRAAAVASKDQAKMDAVRDQGMAIWAKANSTLAAKVKPGQSGYDAIQGALAGQAAAQVYGYQMPQQMISTPPPGVNAPQGLPTVQSFAPTETYGAKGLEIDPEMQKKFQALLNQAKA